MKQWYLIAYDVHEEKRLRKVAKTLEGYGARVQLSIFRCYLAKREIQRLRWELSCIMDLQDQLLVIKLCNRCITHIRETHEKDQWPDDPPQYSII